MVLGSRIIDPHSSGDVGVDKLPGVTWPEEPDEWVSSHASGGVKDQGEGDRDKESSNLRRFGDSTFEKTCAEGPKGSTHIEP